MAPPSLAIGVRVDPHWQQRKVRQRVAVPKIGVVATTPDTHLENVGDLEPPQARDPRPIVRNQMKNMANSFGRFASLSIQSIVAEQSSTMLIADLYPGRP